MSNYKINEKGGSICYEIADERIQLSVFSKLFIWGENCYTTPRSLGRILPKVFFQKLGEKATMFT